VERVHFWRDKQDREVDFVIPRGRHAVDAIECKWNPSAFEARGLSAFRDLYPRGRNYVVSPLQAPSYVRVQGRFELRFVSPGDLRTDLATPRKRSKALLGRGARKLRATPARSAAKGGRGLPTSLKGKLR
jgi:hypothetical protein